MRRFVTFLIILVAAFSAYLIAANVKGWWPFVVDDGIVSPTPTPTPSTSSGPTPTASATPRFTPSPTPKTSPTPTPTPTPTATPTPYISPAPTVIPPTGSTIYYDPAGHYSIVIPQSWDRSRLEGRGGTYQNSYLQFDTSDFAFRNGTGDYYGRVYYDRGARLMIHEVRGSWPYQPHLTSGSNSQAGIVSTSNITVDGTAATYHVFVHPRVYEGKMLDAHFIRNNITYLLTFVYDPNSFPTGESTFNDIINSFKFSY